MSNEVLEMKPAAGYDVTQYELQDTCRVTIKTQRGDDALGEDGQPIVFELWSPGSEAGVRALHSAGRSAQLRMKKMISGDIDVKDAEKADAEQVRKLVAFTKSISRNLPLTAQQVYENPKLRHWKDQIEKAVSDYGNF